MTRPFTKLESITYHHSDSEDSAEIVDIARTYGDRLEKLNQEQRLDLLLNLADVMANERFLSEGATPRRIIEKLDSMSNDTLLALIIATAHQLRADLNHERNS